MDGAFVLVVLLLPEIVLLSMGLDLGRGTALDYSGDLFPGAAVVKLKPAEE